MTCKACEERRHIIAAAVEAARTGDMETAKVKLKELFGSAWDSSFAIGLLNRLQK